MSLEQTPTTSGLQLRRASRSPRDDLGEDPDVDSILERSRARRLLCRACAQPITADEHRVAIEGRHIHRRTNPSGFEFEFGCFCTAPGAVAVGAATEEHTWFAGLAWRFSVCGRCGFHLGWLFEGGGASFHGLILNRLEEEAEPTNRPSA